jgi:hypothetical protein
LSVYLSFYLSIYPFSHLSSLPLAGLQYCTT